MINYLVSVFTNTYFLLFVTAALGAALGKIKVKGFSLGGTGGIFVGRVLMKMSWPLLAGAICGGCTSSVGLGTALSTMDSDEPIVGYGISQPFAILANVIMISLFHSYFFI